MKVGDEITVKLKLAVLDLSDSTYTHGFQITGMNYEDEDCEVWLTEEDIQLAVEGANPELKKQRIQRQIEELQKQLEEV